MSQFSLTIIDELMIAENGDMCYLSKDETYPNRSSMSKNFYNCTLVLNNDSLCMYTCSCT